MIEYENYKFTSNWVGSSAKYWKTIIEEKKYNSLLEIGTWEGRSLLNFVEFGIKNVTCLDIWGNKEVYSRFLHNKKVMEKTYYDLNINPIKGRSWVTLGSLLQKENEYDLIYVDGSHYPHNVLIDACLSFRLLRVGGCIIFDDYGWNRRSVELTPKPAIDVFETIHSKFIEPAKVRSYQRAWYKLDDMKKYN